MERFRTFGTWALFLLLVVIFCARGWSQSENDPPSRPDSPSTTENTKDSQAEGSTSAPPSDADQEPKEKSEGTKPLVILVIGIAVVLGLIIALKVNAFIALITAAIVVSVLSVVMLGEGSWADSIERVATAFGVGAGKIGIVIALAAVIGKCMLDSGAADRIVRAFLRLFGEERSPIALMGSGFVLAVPVFFDTVFYLLVPLARSLYRSTQRNYLKYILAISAGGAITHTLVPPTPGPLVMAQTLNFDVGVMIMIGALVALPSAIAGLIFAGIMDSRMNVPMRQTSSEPEPDPLKDEELPSLILSLLPVVLPVLMISTNTVVETMAKNAIVVELRDSNAGLPPAKELKATVDRLLRSPEELKSDRAIQLSNASGYTNAIGNANLALLLATAIAIYVLFKQRGLSRIEMSQVVEQSLMSAGVIILITAGGVAFGEMLKVAKVGPAILELLSVGGGGIAVLMMAFVIASLLKIAQGSSTAAMIIGSAMLAGIADPADLGFHPVYLATAIGAGSLCGSWMNDSGFWIFTKMGGLTEIESLKSWTIMLIVLGVVSFLVTILLSVVMPLA